MDDITTTKLRHDEHVYLDQPLLRLPHETVRKNFKSAQRLVEQQKAGILSSLKATANASLAAKEDSSQTIDSLNNMIKRMQGLKRKMETLHDEEKTLHQASRKRLQHLQDLHEIPGLTDVKYDQWSRIRLNRLLVEYLTRQGYSESAKALAKHKGIEDLVDLDVFARCHKIALSLKERRLDDCLNWCLEHKAVTKKFDTKLEFQVRLQQYIELCRAGRLSEAREHAQKHLNPHKESHGKTIIEAAALLANPPYSPVLKYLVFIAPIASYAAAQDLSQLMNQQQLYSDDQWNKLYNLFFETHHHIFSIPGRASLLITLSAGLSALKTPSCHSEHASSTANASSTTTSVCPICSTELNELARPLPYAHHTKSNVENDPVVLPNGRVCGRDRLLEMSAKVGLAADMVKDPITAKVYPSAAVRKVYIS